MEYPRKEKKEHNILGAIWNNTFFKITFLTLVSISFYSYFTLNYQVTTYQTFISNPDSAALIKENAELKQKVVALQAQVNALKLDFVTVKSELPTSSFLWIIQYPSEVSFISGDNQEYHIQVTDPKFSLLVKNHQTYTIKANYPFFIFSSWGILKSNYKIDSSTSEINIELK